MGATLLNFWQWMGSALVSNALRGMFGEYLVALAVRAADGVQEEWAAYDVNTLDGIKIEVKTSGYIQTWVQNKFSIPQFDIAPTYSWDPATNEFGNERSRSSDVYVFCLHHHREQSTIDPLDMGQWTFFVLSTGRLNCEVGGQQSISLNRLPQVGAEEVHFDELERAIRSAIS